MKSTPDKTPRRKRSVTSVALSWLTDRMKRAEQVKEAVSSGTYQIPTEEVARKLVTGEDEHQTI